MQNIQRGSTGPDVKVLTGLLIVMGYLLNPAYESWLSQFGSRTEAAVRKYQLVNKLEVDGIVGPQTWGSLLAAHVASTEPQTAHFKLCEMNTFEPRYADLWAPAPASLYPTIQTLFTDILEPLRSRLNEQYANGGEVRVMIRSGYRPTAYNAKIGGEGGSRHILGMAADVFAVTVDRDGARHDHTPNCYLIARAAQNLWPWVNSRPSKYGWGLGSNVNLHLDTRTPGGFWWYKKPADSWEAWQASQ